LVTRAITARRFRRRYARLSFDTTLDTLVGYHDCYARYVGQCKGRSLESYQLWRWACTTRRRSYVRARAKEGEKEISRAFASIRLCNKKSTLNVI
jgi:hypothetical protein